MSVISITSEPIIKNGNASINYFILFLLFGALTFWLWFQEKYYFSAIPFFAAQYILFSILPEPEKTKEKEGKQ